MPDFLAIAQGALATYDHGPLGIDVPRATEALQQQLAANYGELNEKTVQQQRHRRFQIPGAQPSDYGEFHAALNDERSLLFGIRHEGLRSDLPFIHVDASFPVDRRSEAVALFETLAKELAVFKPARVRLFHRRGDLADQVGMVTMAARVRDLRTSIAFDKNLGIEPITDPDYFEWYRGLYSDFHRHHPELAVHVPANSRELMETSRAQGLLYYGTLGGERFGLIAGERLPLLGLQGVYFNEIVIGTPWLGRGLAKQLQRAFIDQVCQPDDVVWGTIDSRNRRSLGTARALGRRAIRHECFVRP